MAKKKVSELLVETLAAASVERIYGVSGDSLNGITDSIRRQEQIQWIHMRHEEAAAFAAGAEAHLTGKLAVCAGSCGPGNLHLINGLYDCHRSRVPVLALAAQIPSSEIGSGYFQETHPEHVFAQCSHYCELRVSARADASCFGDCDPDRAFEAWRFGGRHPRRHCLARCRRARAASAFSAADTNRMPLRSGNRKSGENSQSVEEDHDSGRSGLRGGARGTDRACGQAEGPHRACHARKGIHRIRQPVRRGNDRPAGIFLRLSRHDELRSAADARNGLSLSAVLSEGCDDRPD